MADHHVQHSLESAIGGIKIKDMVSPVVFICSSLSSTIQPSQILRAHLCLLFCYLSRETCCTAMLLELPKQSKLLYSHVS